MVYLLGYIFFLQDIYTINISICWSNSIQCLFNPYLPKMPPFSYQFFLKSSHSMFIFDTIAVFDPIRQFVPKIYFSISKKFQLVSRLDLVFEICLDSKFPARGDTLKKSPPIQLVILIVSIRSPFFFFLLMVIFIGKKIQCILHQTAPKKIIFKP